MPKKKAEKNNTKWTLGEKLALIGLIAGFLYFAISISISLYQKNLSPSDKIDKTEIVDKTEKADKTGKVDKIIKSEIINKTDKIERIDKLEASVLFTETHETPMMDTVKLTYAIKNSGTETAIVSRFYSQYFIGENFPSSFGVGKLIDLTPYPITIKPGDIYIIKHKFRSMNNELYVMDGYPDSSTTDPNKYRYAYIGISWWCNYTGIEYSWEAKIFKIHMTVGRDWWSSDTIQSTSELINTEPINLCIHPLKRIK